MQLNLAKPTSEPRSGYHSECFDIYIAYFRKRAPMGVEKREELEPERRHANRGRILASKKVQFFLLVAEYEVTSREKRWALLLHLEEDMWQVFLEKKIIFLKQPKIFSLFIQQISEAFFLSFHVAFLLPSSPPLLSIKAPKFLLISTPNYKEKPFSEPWNLPQLRGASNFRYGWTSSHMKFVGVGFLGAMMGSSTRFLP